MERFRRLTQNEIESLKGQMCSAADWSTIEVAQDFSPEHVRYARFSGNIRLGSFRKEFSLAGGMCKHSGIYYATLHNVTVGDDCCIENVKNYIANYTIGSGTFIENVDIILADGVSTFGNGVEVSVLNETGGCEVMMYDRLSAQLAYIMAFYRHRPSLLSKLRRMIDRYVDSVKSSVGTIGKDVVIADAGYIKNVRVGDSCKIEGAARLKNGSINSNSQAPVHIGVGVIGDDFIISSGSSVEDGVTFSRCFIGQACKLGHNYSASDSLFFSNCHGENGEACAIFAGPFTVTHHKSTLLIAGMFSFMNAGSGSNQSNHLYKLGPIHHGVMERGSSL
jgi:NDP-sugar pyrophosphorylase family protein